METEKFDTQGFVRVDGRPELSYENPKITLGRSTFRIGQPDSHVRGSFLGGAALEIHAVSRQWLLEAMREGEHHLTCRGSNIARVLSPESDREGIGEHTADYLDLIVETGGTIRLRLEAVIGDSIHGNRVPRIAGLPLTAVLEVDRSRLRAHLLRLAR